MYEKVYIIIIKFIIILIVINKKTVIITYKGSTLNFINPENIIFYYFKLENFLLIMGHRMFIGDMLLYLKHLIAGDTDAIVKLNQLKNLYRTFKPSKYRYITKDRIVTNLFLQKVFGVYQNINKFKVILESGLFSTDEKKSAIYLNYFIESYLPEEMQRKKDKFLKDIMLQKVLESENPGKMMKSIESDFNMYKRFFVRTNLPKLETDYILLYRLNTLATFNFDLFFSKFDSEFDGRQEKPPVYTPINGKEVLNEITDLYFLITSLPKKTDLSNAFRILLSRVEESDNKKIIKLINSAIDNIFKITANELSPLILLNMVKYLAEDPKKKIRVDLKNFSILDKFRHDIDERFYKNKDFVLEKYSEQSLQGDIKALFKGRSLLPIEYYTNDLIEALHANDIDNITGIQGLKITKTFIFEIYEKRIKELLNVFILEAFFNEKGFQQEISDTFFKVNELVNYFIESEKSITNANSNSLKALNTILASSNKNKMKMIVRIINEKIEKCIVKCGESFYILGTKIFEILKDYKLKKPEKIDNIHTIKGGQNKEFINSFVNAYNDLAKFLKLIKKYVNIDSSKK